MFEFGVAQNVFEFLFPYGTRFDIQYLLDEIREHGQEPTLNLTTLGLDKAKGYFTLTKDPKKLEQLVKAKKSGRERNPKVIHETDMS